MFSKQRVPIRGLIAAAFVLAAAAPLTAQTTYDWSNASGGVFQTAANWSPTGGPPASLDTARFNLNGTYAVTFNADRTNQFLHIGSDNIDLNLSGRTFTQTGDYPTVTMGLAPGDVSTMVVRNGTWSSNWTALGLFWPGQVTLTLPGPVTWQNTNAIYIGGAATATVEANNGASVTCLWTTVGATGGDNNGSGELRVIGPATTWTCNGSVMEVGRSSEGTLEVSSGGRVNSGFAIIGTLGGTLGTATVTGVNSLWDVAGGLTVGEEGVGVLHVSAGGRVVASQLMLGRHASSSADVIIGGTVDILADGAYCYVGYEGPASLTLNGNLNVTDPGGTLGGDDGYTVVGSSAGATGLLTINAGGSYSSSAQLQLGALTGSQGTVVINTGGSAISRLAASSPSGAAGNVGRDGTGVMTIAGGLWNCLDGALNVGFNSGSDGTIAITNGGQALSVGGAIGRVAGATGRVSISGANSNWTSSAALNVGPAGPGTLTVFSGGRAAAPTLAIGTTGTVEGNGTLIGAVSNGGVVAPGDMPGPLDIGTLSITGAYTQTTGGKLVIELSGTGLSQRDLLAVSGAVSLSGTLQVNLIGGFQPQFGDEFTIVTGGSVADAFTALTGPANLEAVYSATFVKLRVCRPCDANCDGSINGRDVQTFVGILLGTSLPCGSCAGDANLDHGVTTADVASFVQCLTQ